MTTPFPFVILHLHQPERWVKILTDGRCVECTGHEALLWQAWQEAAEEVERLRAALANVTPSPRR